MLKITIPSVYFVYFSVKELNSGKGIKASSRAIETPKSVVMPNNECLFM